MVQMMFMTSSFCCAAVLIAITNAACQDQACSIGKLVLTPTSPPYIVKRGCMINITNATFYSDDYVEICLQNTSTLTAEPGSFSSISRITNIFIGKGSTLNIHTTGGFEVDGVGIDTTTIIIQDNVNIDVYGGLSFGARSNITFGDYVSVRVEKSGSLNWDANADVVLDTRAQFSISGSFDTYEAFSLYAGINSTFIMGTATVIYQDTDSLINLEQNAVLQLQNGTYLFLLGDNLTVGRNASVFIKNSASCFINGLYAVADNTTEIWTPGFTKPGLNCMKQS